MHAATYSSYFSGAVLFAVINGCSAVCTPEVYWVLIFCVFALVHCKRLLYPTATSFVLTDFFLSVWLYDMLLPYSFVFFWFVYFLPRICNTFCCFTSFICICLVCLFANVIFCCFLLLAYYYIIRLLSPIEFSWPFAAAFLAQQLFRFVYFFFCFFRRFMMTPPTSGVIQSCGSGTPNRNTENLREEIADPQKYLDKHGGKTAFAAGGCCLLLLHFVCCCWFSLAAAVFCLLLLSLVCCRFASRC